MNRKHCLHKPCRSSYRRTLNFLELQTKVLILIHLLAQILILFADLLGG